jgi:hypothetical protein
LIPFGGSSRYTATALIIRRSGLASERGRLTGGSILFCPFGPLLGINQTRCGHRRMSDITSAFKSARSSNQNSQRGGAQRTFCDRIDMIKSLQSNDAIRETRNFR